MNILLTGGAGYIGSVTSEMLITMGINPVIYDNLSTGHQEAIHNNAIFINGDLGDKAKLTKIFNDYKIDAILHLSGSSQVGESMANPSKYFFNNVSNGINLLDAMISANVRKIVFSSTAAVYGHPAVIPVPESSLTEPSNPYGESKLAFENILKWYSKVYGISFVSLRYFNAAGASGKYGEDHNPETHLIPLVLKVAMKKREEIVIYGSDYPTPDGSCIRDYIHVHDLAKAHILALTSTKSDNQIYNLGNGNGYSVLNVIETARKITGKGINVKIGNRRVGDPPVLIASSEKINTDLGWKSELSSMESIIESAWSWHMRYPDGY
jgi:UDP-glucose 4-epimerase